MKKLLSILFVMTLVLGVAACAPVDRLKQDIKRSNKDCPMDLGGGLKITKFTYDESTSECVMHLNLPSGIDVEDLDREKVEMKQALMAAFSGSDKEIKDMLELLADADSGMRIDITSGFNRKSTSISISPSEIKTLLLK